MRYVRGFQERHVVSVCVSVCSTPLGKAMYTTTPTRQILRNPACILKQITQLIDGVKHSALAKHRTVPE